MNTRKILAMAMAGIMLAGPMSASAATTTSNSSTKSANASTHASCKGLTGKALKDCQAKLKMSAGNKPNKT